MSNLTAEADDTLRTRCAEVKPRMAKAELELRTQRDERAAYGAILRRASELAGLNRDQTADALGVTGPQISRWWSGEENSQRWRYQRHAKLRAAVRLAEAFADDTVEVETLIRVKRA